jgi:hypothetical protein
VKLLRAHGLRDVERMREDELKDALSRLSLLLPDLQRTLPAMSAPPPASMPVSRRSDDAAPATIDDENAWCLPRFREPRIFVPEGDRTFLRLVAVKPRLLFFTWDIAADVAREAARLEIVVRETLGEPPAEADLLAQPASFVVDIDLRAPGWYVDVAPERFAVVARLFVGDRLAASSNLALTPPARPAPPGPLWMATIKPGVDRRALRGGGVLRGKLPDGAGLEVAGEVLPEPTSFEPSLPLPSSAERARGPDESPPSSGAMPARSRLPRIESGPSSSSLLSSSSLPSSSSSSSSASLSSSALAAGRIA